MTNGKKIMLLDGTGLVYRAYFAFITRPLTTTRGENTSAIFGFFRILIQILRDFKPDAVYTAFDISRKTFRTDFYPAYKAQREETPPDLKAQIPVVIEIMKLMGLPALELDNYEADDIVGTLSARYNKDNLVYIVSSDKDLLQLVNANALAIRPQQGISQINLLDREGVKAALGVYPEQVPDYLAIVGDTSDNIPGVKGIGEKGAIQLLTTYKNLDEIYANIDNIKGAAQKKLIESKENAYLSLKLAQIECNAPIDTKDLPAALNWQNLINPSVVAQFEHYQVTSLINDFKKLASNEKESEPETAGGLFAVEEKKLSDASELTGDYQLILSKKDLAALCEELSKASIISLDTETTSAEPVSAGLIGVSVSVETGKGAFLPALYQAGQEFTMDELIKSLKPLLEDPKIPKVGQNIKYEMEVFAMLGVTVQGYCFDTMLAAYLLNTSRTHNNLESLVLEYLGIKKKDYKEVLKPIEKKDKTLLDAPIGDLVNYACGDSDTTLRLYQKLKPLIESAGLGTVLFDIEIPLAPVLSEMELTGVLISKEHLKVLSTKLDGLIKTTEAEIYKIAGHSFNINSPIQLSKILFEEQKLDVIKKTDGGKASTDEEVLKILATVHPLPAEIVKFRTYTKLKNTYVDSLPLLINAKTGRVHTNFNQTIAATGRLSSTDPNLQNIPIRDDLGREIREAFTAAPGCLLISADYSQIELRVLAHFCGDEAMKSAFTEGLDIHRHTASIIFNIKENEVTDEMRRRAKSVNFGILYGLQAYGLSRQIGISMAEAKVFIESYFASFPRVRAFVEKALEEARDTGEIRTLSGRRRLFPDLLGKAIKDPTHMSSSQRMAMNTKIQGSAADIIKIAMIRVQKAMAEKKLSARMILQIHDELVVEAPENEAQSVREILKTVMEGAYTLTVPLTVEVGEGSNWSTAH